jgi:hypothetical protein
LDEIPYRFQHDISSNRLGTVLAKQSDDIIDTEETMSIASQHRYDWESRMRRLMRDESRFPWIIFAVGFVLGAWIF